MKRFVDWSLLQKLLSVSISVFLLVAAIMFALYAITDKQKSIDAYVEKARAICLTAESTREEMETKWEKGLFSAEQLIKYAEAGERDKILAAVPVVSAWNAAMRKAKEGGYEFRVPKFEPRNPKNAPDYGLDYQIEGPALKKMKAENLSEYYIIDERINAIRYFLPVRLTKTCLLCHGEPQQSKELWGRDDGKDPTDGPMEDWKVGSIHGAFEVVQSLDAADAARADRLFTAGIIVLISALGFCFVNYLIASSVSKSIGTSVTFAKKMADGDFSQELKVDREDETGALANAMNMMTLNLRQMIEDIKGGVGTLSKSSRELAGVAEVMNENAASTSGKSNSVASAANQMSSNMNSVSAAVEETSTNVGSVASAAEEMTTTINEISENTEKSQRITANAVAQATTASEKVNELGVAAERIGKVTETITAISDKTNLLALNATIEAARAGSAGKGFAVVANEIKDLARQTSEATLEISQSIKGIQLSSKETAQQIEEISAVINKVDEIVSAISTTIIEQNKATLEIASNISEASLGIQEVTENVAQTSTASSEVAQDITEVNESATKISESSEQVQVSAQDLSELSEQLTKMVSRFKL